MPWSNSLNKSQVEAIRYSAGHAAVVAGPGTGKTKTLLHKALKLIEDDKILPEQIAIVNFTNIGVIDLRHKLRTDSNYSALTNANVTTFHHLALRSLLRVSAPSIPKPVRILDDWEEDTLVDQFAKQKMGFRDIRQARHVREDYDSKWCMVEGDSADQWLNEGDRRKYEEVYTLGKSLLRFITRGEITYLWWRWLRGTQAKNRNDMSFEYSHLLVDEYQDLNECEHEILRRLAEAGVTIFAAGDPNQSIYESLRHAHPEFCWDFPNRVAPGKVFILTESYRCPAVVLRAGITLFGSSSGIPDPNLAKTEGDFHSLVFPSFIAECSGIARIASKLATESKESRILLAIPRRRLVSQVLTELDRAKVKYVDATKKPLVKENNRLAEALVRLSKDSSDSVSITTAMFLMSPKSSRSSIFWGLLAEAESRSLTVSQLFHKNTNLPKDIQGIFRKITTSLQELEASADPIEYLMKATGCDETIHVEPQELSDEDAAKKDSFELEKGCVTVMTVNAAKGLEAEWVLMPSVEPAFYEGGLVGRLREEKKRLFYVGITRAKKGLFVSYVRIRQGTTRFGDPTGSTFWKGPSDFLSRLFDHNNVSPVGSTEFLRRFLSG